MSSPETLGLYQVERELGRGGMGVVYLARDQRLGRQVAIKMIPETLSGNPENLARFEREAKLLAAVNHPNIASIYSIEERPSTGQATRGFMLVMEYVPGDTLSDRLISGPMPVREALDVARQIALAIEAAHEAGIIHRDLKPGNVRVTADGVVKVLDFGLAKSAAPSQADAAQSPTLTYSPTGIGVILGTAGYMSPEQARGKPVDRRADIWAFGCVLYECLTGRKTFEGETVSDTIARIIERDVDLDALPPATPAAIRELLRRCLEKDVRKRQRDMGDVRLEIENALAARSPASGVAPSHRPEVRHSIWQRWGIPVLSAVAGVAAGTLLASSMGSTPASTKGAEHVSIAIPPNIRPTGLKFVTNGRDLILSGFPRGSDGAEDSRMRLYYRSLSDFQFKEIPGTEGAIDWSRSQDGKWLAVLKPTRDQSSDLTLVRVPVDGSSPATPITEWKRDWSEPKWLNDGDLLILTARGTKFFRQPAGGGSPKPEVAFDFGGPTGYPTLSWELPGKSGVIVRLETFGPQGYQSDVYVLNPDTGKAKRILENAWTVYYDPSSQHIFFSRRGTIHAVPFDLATLTPGNEPIAILDGLRANPWNHGAFEVAIDGTIAFLPGGRLGTDRRLVVVEPNRDLKPFVPERRAYEEDLSVSVDGNRIAVVIADARGTYEIWTASRDRPGLRRTIAIDNADCASPLWSPDGRWLAFMRNARDKDDGVWLMRSDGTGDALPVFRMTAEQFAFPTGWLPDSSAVLVTKIAGARIEPLLVRVSKDGVASPPEVMRDTKNNAGGVVVSPDGTLALFSADDSGRPENYLSAFVAGKISGEPVPIGSIGDPQGILWMADSKRFFYNVDRNRIMTATVERSPSLRASPSTLLADLNVLRLDQNAWDIMPDGRLVGIQLGLGEDDVRSYSLVFNWLESARTKLGKK